jgi:hypothetical protein
MKRSLGTSLLVLLILLVTPATASAGFWAWLEEWSGPGPFRGYTILFTACVQDRFVKASPIAVNDAFHTEQWKKAQALHALYVKRADPDIPSDRALFRRLLANPDPLNLAVRIAMTSALTGPASTRTAPPLSNPPGTESAPRESISLERVLDTLVARAPELYLRSEAENGPGHEDGRPWCGYFDYGRFKASANDQRGFPDITTQMFDLGPSARLHDGVDLGVGFGWATFNGEGVTAAPHLTVTPFRLVMRPALIAVPEAYRKRWMGLVSIYWKETYVVGRLKAKDFGSAKDPFQVNGELIRSFGLNVDITALFPAKWGID